MKIKNRYKIFLFLLLAGISTPFHSQERSVFPAEEISQDFRNSGNIKIVVFMPAISDETEYASMIVQAFRNYFVKKLSFSLPDRDKVNIDIILISNKKAEKRIQEKINNKKNQEEIYFREDAAIEKEVNKNFFDMEGMHVFYGVGETLKNKLALPSLENFQADSVLFLLDESNTIVWRDDHYRGQGEHLKPLEYKIKKLLGISYPKISFDQVFVKEGDKVPEVQITQDKKISDLKGNILVLTFYPAAYSGVFDVRSMVQKISRERLSLISCAVHITSFDEVSLLSPGNVQYFAISESTSELLENWKQALGTHYIQYLNDSDYSLSKYFGAYNSEGYNSRVTVIIDTEGKIAFIDKEYTLDKEQKIKEVIKKLQYEK